MTRKIIGPFSRVEGHLEIELNRNDTQVIEARVNSPMYRGMETVMLGRAPMDALTIVPRICGICSVSQSVAAAQALGNLAGITPPPNGQRVTNLVLSCEMLSNHLTHFYLFFMPDFARDIYANEPWYNEALRFQAQKGPAQAEALEARTRFLHIMGELAGKWPHTLALRPGGTTSRIHVPQKMKLHTLLKHMRRFLERTLYDAPLEEMLALRSVRDLEAWAEKSRGDLAFFVKVSRDLNLTAVGKNVSLLLSGGGLRDENGALFKQGVYQGQHIVPLPIEDIREDLSHSFMGGPQQQHPQQGINEPLVDKADAYSWCKAPRLHDERAETGALARQVIRGTPLFCDLYQHYGSTVETRIFARAWEMAQLVCAMEDWITAIDPSDIFYHSVRLPDYGDSFAFVEAARGTLGHWLSVEDAQISNYQIIAPTTWNFSPRDHKEIPGPLETALAGAPIRPGEDDPVAVQHIVRSFDPCMACTVH